jgi:hypothetical protein
MKKYFHKIYLSIVVLLSFLPLVSKASAKKDITTRINDVRAALHKEQTKVNKDKDITITGNHFKENDLRSWVNWGNWGNWNNWNDWNNWAKWNNWGNWGNWANY